MKIEVLGTERQRRWSLQDKLQIVEETLQPGVTVTEVARRHGLAPSVVFTWRRLARKAKTGRLWTVVRDDRPFAGADPPAAVYFYSPDRKGEHPQGFLKSYSGTLQADAYSGFGQLYEPGRATGAATEAACRAHARRKFFEHRVTRAPEENTPH
jgi:Transposase IS66 family/Transposase